LDSPVRLRIVLAQLQVRLFQQVVLARFSNRHGIRRAALVVQLGSECGLALHQVGRVVRPRVKLVAVYSLRLAVTRTGGGRFWRVVRELQKSTVVDKVIEVAQEAWKRGDNAGAARGVLRAAGQLDPNLAAVSAAVDGAWDARAR
jgi:hypothetical protein